MKNAKINESLKKSCLDAVESFNKINHDKFGEIKDKLNWVIGSYEFDKNPVGLHEIGQQALQALLEHKKDKPRAVTKKVLDTLEKSINQYQEVYQ